MLRFLTYASIIIASLFAHLGNESHHFIFATLVYLIGVIAFCADMAAGKVIEYLKGKQ